MLHHMQELLLKDINLVYISSEEIKLPSDKKSALWDTALAIPNTQKLHCIRANNVEQLEVSIVSSDESFSLVNIFKVPEDTESESWESQLNPIFKSDIQIDIGDWVLVHYQGSNFPGEVTGIYGLDFQVNVVHKSGNVFWKWPLKEDKILYEMQSVLAKLGPPEMAGTRGQFTFRGG